MPRSSTVRAVVPLARRRGPVRTLIATGVTVAVLTTGCQAPSLDATRSGASTPLAQQGFSSMPGQPTTPPTAPGSSLVATGRGDRVPVRSAPGGRVTSRLRNPTAIGAPLTFLVLDRRPGWLKVQLPVRPNGSSGWVAQSDVSIASTPYRLVVSMSKHRLDVIYQGRRVARHPVGVGTVATPTPKGTYYLTELIQPPDPSGAYGPYAFGLSAFSDSLTTFAGGPGQLGLHGTDAPHGLGRDISHGCIRVANTVITELAGQLPLGTPIELRA
jgi:lipoprotein-anchoring transpeptidase ErfK/SrfK